MSNAGVHHVVHRSGEFGVTGQTAANFSARAWRIRVLVPHRHDPGRIGQADGAVIGHPRHHEASHPQQPLLHFEGTIQDARHLGGEPSLVVGLPAPGDVGEDDDRAGNISILCVVGGRAGADDATVAIGAKQLDLFALDHLVAAERPQQCRLLNRLSADHRRCALS